MTEKEYCDWPGRGWSSAERRYCLHNSAGKDRVGLAQDRPPEPCFKIIEDISHSDYVFPTESYASET